ncbi:MAG: hypothetical protein U9N08_03205 [Candidatus Caldatribacteriota bacterium]|nr:hypothetical protein [Candidatus Caldatribacteriota bacterium]
MKKKKIFLFVVGSILLGIIILGLFKLLTSGEEIIKVEANPGRGFNYEYYLYIPQGAKDSEIKYMLIEPNNTGKASDNHDIHLKKVEKLINQHPKRIAGELKVPFLIPAFDRLESDWRMYTHALDSDTLKNTEGKLARIDLQLISMINDAQNRLREKGIILGNKVFMNGFSASGNFTNRFVALHPEIVQAVVSGGVNCMPIIPCEEWEGIRLPFHVGVADIDKIADIQFDLEKYKKVAQYIYMGEIDNNDTLPYDDAFNEAERRLVKELLGEEMKGRWEKTKKIYQHLNIPAQMVMYDGVGHEIKSEIIEDIIEFFRLNTEEEIRYIKPYKAK